MIPKLPFSTVSDEPVRRRDARGVRRAQGQRSSGPVSLWWVALDAPSPALEDLERDLAPAEQLRAARFLRPEDRRRYVAARWSLRHVLADRLGCAPRDVPIVADDRGKPGLAGSELRFSTSRSGGVALHAVGSIEVGVDVEAIREGFGFERIAARFFTLSEQRELAALPPQARQAAGFRCWTRKEAYVKGLGDGLGLPLQSVHVGLGGSVRMESGWSVHQLDVAPGFAAALAGLSSEEWQPGPLRSVDIAGLPLAASALEVDSDLHGTD